MKSIINTALIFILLFINISILSSQTTDSKTEYLRFTPDTAYINKMIPKRFDISETEIREIEKNPASKYYKLWNQNFLTPKSFTNKSKPDSLIIDMTEFHFPFKGVVTSAYGARKKGFHYGYDIKLKIGDTIRCAFDGRVRIERNEPRGYGKYIVVRHSNGLETIYAHLSKFLVKINQPVYAGEPIALGGNTGRSSGAHLHFETRFMGVPIDPGSMVNFKSHSLLAQTVIYTPKNKKIIRVNNPSPLLAMNKISK